MRLCKYLVEYPVHTGSMAAFGSGTEVVSSPQRARSFQPPKKTAHKPRFVKKGKRMAATKDEEQKTTSKMNFGGFKDVKRYNYWTGAGQTTSSPTGWNR